MNLRSLLHAALSEIRQAFQMLGKKGSFVRNTSVMLSGSLAGVVVQLVSTPLLSRLYTPEVYGEFSMFNALSVNLIGIVTLSYTECIPLLKTDRKYFDVFQLVLASSLAWIVALTLFLILGGSHWVGGFFGLSSPMLLWCLPVILLASVVSQSSSGNNVRMGEFARNARVTVFSRILSRVYAILHGIVQNTTSAGLILADMIQHMSGALLNRPRMIAQALKTRFSLHSILQTAREFKSYPLYIFPSRWLIVFGNQVHVYMVAKTYSLGMVGHMGMAITILDLPINLLGGALRPVMLKRLADCPDTTAIQSVVMKTYWAFIILGSLPLALLIVFGPELFRLVLGAPWGEAGTIASLLGFSYLFNLISTPLQGLRRVLGVEHHVLFYTTLLFLVRCIVIPAALLDLDFSHFLLTYAVANGLYNLINTISLLRLISDRVLSVLLRSLALLITTTALVYGIRWIVALFIQF